ncbi:MAG: MBL fold metallo-hydrolase [Myxococcales bacterium]|nr:MBL fold metallo-hydrolase [Myxococcales bacterium]
MSPKIHHLDCCPMRPMSERLVHGTGSLFGRGRMVAHVVCVESSDGLVLVDSGIGLADIREPQRRLGRGFLAAAAPVLDPACTAIRQLEALGYAASDVRHIVVTHLDLDHAGGLGDFPAATVHVLRAEHEAAMNRVTRNERERYRPEQWAHRPQFRLHDSAKGERFLGFELVRAIVEPEVLLLPAHGHTRGHAVVAIATAAGHLVHAGDAYFSRHELETPPSCPPALALFQRAMSVDDPQRRHNQQRLRDLKRDGGDRVRVFSAHDATEFAALRG